MRLRNTIHNITKILSIFHLELNSKQLKKNIKYIFIKKNETSKKVRNKQNFKKPLNKVPLNKIFIISSIYPNF